MNHWIMLQYPNANGIFSKFTPIPHVLVLTVLNCLQVSKGNWEILWSSLTLG